MTWTDKLGPEWRGKLLPEAVEMDAASLARWRKSGIVTHVTILPACGFGEKLQDVLFPLDRPPTLPLEGCDRKPCCGCSLIAILGDEGGSDAKIV